MKPPVLDLDRHPRASYRAPASAPSPVPIAPRRGSPLVPVLAVLLVAAVGALAWFMLGKPGSSGTSGNNADIGGLAEEASRPGVPTGVADHSGAPSAGTRPSAVFAPSSTMPALAKVRRPAASAAPVAPAPQTADSNKALVSGFRAAATAAASRASASPRDLSPAPSGAPHTAPIPSVWARSATVREAIATLSGGQRPDKFLSSPTLPKTATVSLDDPLVVKAILSYVSPSENSQKLLLEKIKLSDHVHDKFPETADNALFVYLPDDDLVNADASIVSDEGGATHGRIRLYGGLVRMARTMGAVVCAGLPSRNREPAAVLAFLEALGSSIRTAGGKFSTDAMLDLLDQFETDPECFTDLSRRARAETVANAIVTAALAHEFGHLAKGHLNGTDANHIVTQIEEKEADLFASTIAASSPEGPHVFMGQVFVMTIFSFIDDGSGSGLRTHPVPRDRVFEAIRNNPDYAAKARITEEGFRTWFREIDEKKGK